MRYAWKFGMIVCFAVLASLSFAQETPEDASAALTQKWVDNWNNGDMAAIAALYTEDGDILGGSGQMASGRAAIESYVSELRAGPFAGMTLSVDQADMRCVTENTCISDSSYEFSGGEATVSGLTTIVMVNDGGDWRIAAHRSRVPFSSGQ